VGQKIISSFNAAMIRKDALVAIFHPGTRAFPRSASGRRFRSPSIEPLRDGNVQFVDAEMPADFSSGMISWSP
jgi:hypothetical protein